MVVVDIFTKVNPCVKRASSPVGVFVVFNYRQPILHQLLQERIAIDIVHEHNLEHGCQSREAPCPFDTPLHDHKQEIGDERYPYLYLDGIGTLSIEISQREVFV